MNPVTPIAPTAPLPGPFTVPTPTLELPQADIPLWQPIPIYQDDIPGLPKTNSEPETPKEPEVPTERELIDAVQEMITPTPTLEPYVPQAESIEETPSQITTVEILGREIPVPKQEIMVTAVSTAGAAAVASVGATLLAGRMFNQVVKIAKPIFKFALKKIAKFRGKKPPLTWGRQRLELHRRKQGRKVMRDVS